MLPVANKVAEPTEIQRAAELLGEPLFASVPGDEAVRSAELAGAALIDHAPGLGVRMPIAEKPLGPVGREEDCGRSGDGLLHAQSRTAQTIPTRAGNPPAPRHAGR